VDHFVAGLERLGQPEQADPARLEDLAGPEQRTLAGFSFVARNHFRLVAAGALDRVRQRFGVARIEFLNVGVEPVKKLDVSDQAVLDNFSNAGGQFALMEFTGALPKARLYGNWQVQTNDAAALERLASRDFEPAQTVLVADAIAPATATNQNW